MGRATAILAATTIVGFALAGYLLLDREAAPCECAVPTTIDHAMGANVAAASTTPTANPCVEATRAAAIALARRDEADPDVPDTHASRLDRRARITRDIGALLGRQSGETDEQYRSRLGMLIRFGLAGPREHVAEMRKLAEAKAGVTAAQSARLDQAFEKVYADVLDFTNKAIADGQLSPYERNVPGWLEFAGGIGGLLGAARGQVDQILDPSQVRTMYESGFDWSEYLGLHTPWEKFSALPPSPTPK